MKKLLTIFAFLACLSFISHGYANSYYPPYSAEYPYSSQCVGRCEEPCVGKCPHNGFYIGAFGGANWLNVDEIQSIKTKTKIGYVAALSLGYQFNNGFRLEGEVAYRRNHLHHIDGLPDSLSESLTISGFSSTWSCMANFLYDFNCFSRYIPHLVPYVGFGLGYTHLHGNVKAHDEQNYAHFKSTSNGLTTQIIAGVSYRLTDKTSLGLEYRFFPARQHAIDHSLGLALRRTF